MDNHIILYDSPKLNIDNVDSVYNVFKNVHLLGEITGHLEHHVDRINFASTCKFFRNAIFGDFLPKKELRESNSCLVVTSYKNFEVETIDRWNGTFIEDTETYENVVVFEINGGKRFIWNDYNDYVSKFPWYTQNLFIYFKKLQTWIMCYKQFITEVKINFQPRVEVHIYDEIMDILFKSNLNLKAIYMDTAVLHYIWDRFHGYFNIFEKSKIKIKLSFGKEIAMISLKKMHLHLWLKPAHIAEMKCPTLDSLNDQYGKLLFFTIMNYKYFDKISNIHIEYMNIYLYDQKNLKELELIYDLNPDHPLVRHPKPIEGFQCIEKLTLKSNFLKYSPTYVFFLFPVDKCTGKNHTLKELYLPHYTNDNLNGHMFEVIVERFPNIHTLSFVANKMSSFETIFRRLTDLTVIEIHDPSPEMLSNVMGLAKAILHNRPILTISIQSINFIYTLFIEDALLLRNNFGFIYLDGRRLKITSENEFHVYNDDNDSRYNFLRFRNLIVSSIFMSNSLADFRKYSRGRRLRD
uniref:EEV maturation protein n=1 Tax=Parastrongyloides trichosuri TaxID=131310 RepID=A0A0N4ZCH7_PARTI